MGRDSGGKARLKRVRRRLRTPLFRLVLALGRAALSRVPWRTAQRLTATLGTLAWHLSPTDRRRIRRHLGIAFPEKPSEDRDVLGKACLRHLGTCVGEALHLLGREPEEALRHVEIVGGEHLTAAQASARPILVLTAHCGFWELISTANLTHELRLRALARRHDDPALDRAVVGLRSHLGTKTIGRGHRGAAREIRRTLKDNGALGLLIDQDIRTDGVWVPFFGLLAHTPTAAADLALRLGASALPTFTHRRPDGSHRLAFHPPLDLPDDPTEATALMTATIEAQIRRHPEQWVWMHRRWRRRPPGE